jgi:hypothetical protein
MATDNFNEMSNDLNRKSTKMLHVEPDQRPPADELNRPPCHKDKRAGPSFLYEFYNPLLPLPNHHSYS